MKHYNVLSPEMSEIEYIPGLGNGPRVYFCCGCTVEANTKREAKIAAIKSPDMQEWVAEQRSNGANPFTGLMVEEALCEHGICCCEICGWENCKECMERDE